MILHTVQVPNPACPDRTQSFSKINLDLTSPPVLLFPKTEPHPLPFPEDEDLLISPVRHPFLICLGKIKIPQHLSENEAHFQIGQVAPDAVPRAEGEGVVDRLVVVSIGIRGKGSRRAKPALRREAFWRVVIMRRAEGGPIGKVDDCLCESVC